MNFIKQLQAENEELKAKLASATQSITDFMVFLNGPKFTGTENGERKDWIATGDVQTRLSQLRSELNG
jgi:hypothetical protein